MDARILLLMPAWMIILVLMALAYVMGATPFGFLAAKAYGIDIRQRGSGNIGATNVIRVLGKKVGLPVFALDVLKGLLPVVLAGWWTARSLAFAGHPIQAQLAEVLTGLAVVVGHTATFWLGFKGGKGVATSAGVMLGLAPWVLLAALLVWAVAMAIWRFVSLASILAAWTLPIAAVVQGIARGRRGQPDLNWPLLALSLLIAGLVTWRHRGNLQRLAAGTEPKAGRRKEGSP
jgi:acyl phosphate:glycerol-3-phosphate acyltransferase